MHVAVQAWFPVSVSRLPERSEERVDPIEAEVLSFLALGQRERALRLLMERHGDAVARYLRAALLDGAMVEDVLQQVFIEVHRDLHRFGGRSSIKAWLFGIARHRALDHNRSARKSAARRRELPASVPDPRPLAGERLDRVRLERALEACLEELGEHVRAAVLLRYQQGFSFEDMAQICSEKAGTLQARVARSLPILRDCISERIKGAV